MRVSIQPSPYAQRCGLGVFVFKHSSKDEEKLVCLRVFPPPQPTVYKSYQFPWRKTCHIARVQHRDKTLLHCANHTTSMSMFTGERDLRWCYVKLLNTNKSSPQSHRNQCWVMRDINSLSCKVLKVQRLFWHWKGRGWMDDRILKGRHKI